MLPRITRRRRLAFGAVLTALAGLVGFIAYGVIHVREAANRMADT